MIDVDKRYAPYSWAWLCDNIDCDFKVKILNGFFRFVFFVKEEDYEYLKQRLYEIVPIHWYYEIKIDNTIKGKKREEIYNG